MVNGCCLYSLYNRYLYPVRKAHGPQAVILLNWTVL